MTVFDDSLMNSFEKMIAALQDLDEFRHTFFTTSDIRLVECRAGEDRVSFIKRQKPFKVRILNLSDKNVDFSRLRAEKCRKNSIQKFERARHSVRHGTMPTRRLASILMNLS